MTATRTEARGRTQAIRALLIKHAETRAKITNLSQTLRNAFGEPPITRIAYDHDR